MRPRAGRPVRVLLTVTALALTVSGCGFANALAHPRTPDVLPEQAPTTAAPTTSSDRTVVEAYVRLATGALGHVSVTVGPIRSGLAPPVTNFPDDCPVSATSLQFVAVGVTFRFGDGQPSPGLAGHLTIRTTAATPAGIGDLGVFFESQDGNVRYCAHYPPLPTTDTFYNHDGPQVTYGYVVLDRAITPTTPQGRPEVFPTLQLQLSDLRYYEPYSEHATPVTPAAPTVGSLCAGSSSAICAPLG